MRFTSSGRRSVPAIVAAVLLAAPSALYFPLDPEESRFVRWLGIYTLQLPPRDYRVAVLIRDEVTDKVLERRSTFRAAP